MRDSSTGTGVELRMPDYLFQDKDGLWFAEYGSFRFRSTFRPVYRRLGAELALEGFQGLPRAISEGRTYRPREAVDLLKNDEWPIVARICRAILFRNFALSGGGTRKIFVTVLPVAPDQYQETASELAAIPSQLKRFGLDTSQAVFEFLVAELMEPLVLAELVGIFRAMKSHIALDEFGTSGSHAKLLAAVQPDYVRLDPALVREAASNARMAALVRSLALSAREAGAEVIMDHVGSRAELDFAVSTNAELLQGGLLGRLGTRIIIAPDRLDLTTIG